MSRLASFNGPSSPSQSPVRVQPGSSPSSPSLLSETTHHRKVRTLLRELHLVTQNWNDLVLVDGLNTAQSLVDTRTELDNDLALLPPGHLPPIGLVAPKILSMEKGLVKLDLVLLKLVPSVPALALLQAEPVEQQKQFEKMAAIVDNIELTLYEAHKTKGCKWVQEEPLWCTWTLTKFATDIPALLPAYHRALYQMRELISNIRSHDTPFETSRDILSKWVTQPWLQVGGWSDWEDLCSIEVERWDSAR